MRFDLIPFNSSIIEISGNISLVADIIECRWTIAGELEKIAWPATERPNREMNLWDHTCVELFIGPLSESRYCEFNLSPSGQWNTFLFDNVRENMRQAQSVECLESSVRDIAEGHRQIETTIRFDTWQDHHEFRVGISSVVELTGGTMQYFALSHPGSRPDFHARSGHEIRLKRTDP
jgi:hypothetical protein